MLQGENSAILLTFTKLPFVSKILPIFEWLYYTGFTAFLFPRQMWLTQKNFLPLTVCLSIYNMYAMFLNQTCCHSEHSKEWLFVDLKGESSKFRKS